jgi:hypothetical protein
MRRAKNLTDGAIKLIVEILDGWTGKLSWQLVLDAIERSTAQRYTRQALHKHTRILAAFNITKRRLKDQTVGVKTVSSPELQIALDRIARLSAEVQRLESENNRFLEQFARWAYNAYLRGLDQDFLNQPLTPIDRGQTR